MGRAHEDAWRHLRDVVDPSPSESPSTSVVEPQRVHRPGRAGLGLIMAAQASRTQRNPRLAAALSAVLALLAATR